MPRKKRTQGLIKEQLAVLRSSPNLKPCSKFRKVNAAKFVEHLNEGKCGQCVAMWEFNWGVFWALIAAFAISGIVKFFLHWNEN
jgi:hypothetical protein